CRLPRSRSSRLGRTAGVGVQHARGQQSGGISVRDWTGVQSTTRCSSKAAVTCRTGGSLTGARARPASVRLQRGSRWIEAEGYGRGLPVPVTAASGRKPSLEWADRRNTVDTSARDHAEMRAFQDDTVEWPSVPALFAGYAPNRPLPGFDEMFDGT